MPRDPAKAAQSFRMGAEKGNLRAMINLTWLYRAGEMGAVDLEKSFTWYRKAAGQRSSDERVLAAMKIVARMHRDGQGTSKSPRKWMKWIRAAAEAGGVESQTDLGWLGLLSNSRVCELVADYS